MTVNLRCKLLFYFKGALTSYPLKFQNAIESIHNTFASHKKPHWDVLSWDQGNKVSKKHISFLRCVYISSLPQLASIIKQLHLL